MGNFASCPKTNDYYQLQINCNFCCLYAHKRRYTLAALYFVCMHMLLILGCHGSSLLMLTQHSSLYCMWSEQYLPTFRKYMLPPSAYVFIYMCMNSSVHMCVNKVDISVFYCVIFYREHVNLVPNGTEPPLGPFGCTKPVM